MVGVKEEVCQILNVMTESLNDKYLGLPALVSAERSDCFQHLVDRVRQRVNGWKEKLLSMGGKEVLIKSIAQAIPVYAMMVFKIPQNICKGISDTISQYWWGDDDEKRGFIGGFGGKCVFLRTAEVWGFGTYKASILLYWPNKFGVC